MYTPKWESPDESVQPIQNYIVSNDVMVTNLNTTEDGTPDDGDSLSRVLSIILREIGEINNRDYDIDAIIDMLTEEFVNQKEYQEALETLVKKEEGKGLSSNDFTDEIKEKVERMYEDKFNSTSNDITVVNLNPIEEDIPDDGDSLSKVLSFILNSLGKLEDKDYDVDSIVNGLTDTFVTKEELESYVVKEDGKGLSTNDFTDEDKETLDHLAKDHFDDIDSNQIVLVNLNSLEDGEIDDGDTLTEGISKILHQLGDLQIDYQGFISEEDAAEKFLSKQDAAALYIEKEDGKGLSSNDFTQDYIDRIVSLENKSLTSNDVYVTNLNTTVTGPIDDGDSLTEAISKLVRDQENLSGKVTDLESVDMSEYPTFDDLDIYVMKEVGKGLSANDFSDEYKSALDELVDSKDDDLNSNKVILTNINSTESSDIDNGDTLSKGISKLMHDIGELQLQIDSNKSDTDTALGEAVTSTQLAEELDKYVLKEQDKGLSHNDFTDSEKDKLSKVKINPFSSDVIVTNVTPFISGEIEDGDTLTRALSVLRRDIDAISDKTQNVDQNVSYDELDQKLSNFIQVSDTQGLSTNDFSNEYKDRLDKLGRIISNDVYMTNLNPNLNGEIDDGDTLSETVSRLMKKIGDLRMDSDKMQNTIEDLNVDYPKFDDVSTLLEDYVKKVDGKDLSSNDFTDDYKEKLDNLKEDPTSDDISTGVISPDPSIDISPGDSLSEVLDTIVSELAKLKNNTSESNITEIVNNNFYNKTEISEIIDDYVKKVDGKDLSSNDFTDDYKEKLDTLTSVWDPEEGLFGTDSNHITVVNTTEVGEQDTIHNGDSLSEVVSKLMYADRLLNFTLRDSYLTRGQIESEYVHKRDGYDLSQNDFTNEYREKLDTLTGGGENSFFYNKEYIDANFVHVEEGKGLSSNDFTNEYKDTLETLPSTYLKLAGGDMNGDINMSSHNITFTSGRIEFLRDGEVYSYLDSERFTGIADEAIHVGNLESIQRSTEYEVGDIAFTAGLPSGMYVYCMKAGITAVLEPVWATSSKDRTIDGTSEWQTRILGVSYNADGEESSGDFLPITGGTMKGIIDMSKNDLRISETNAVSFYSGGHATGSLTKDEYSGNAATATKLKAPFYINDTIEVDGTKNITLDCISSSEKGVANGVATLDNTGRVPASQLPSFVRSVVMVDNYDALPNPGDTEVIYVTEDTNEIYRFTGVSYINVSPTSSASDSAVQLAVARLIRLIGDVTGEVKFDGSKDVAITTTLSNTNALPGTYNTDETIHAITVSHDGRIQEVGPELVIAPKYANLKDKPTTLEGFGITDAADIHHTHVVSDITNFPDSLPANGGNSDTVGGHYPGTSANNVLVLDGSGQIPTSAIPSSAVFNKGMVVMWYGASNEVPAGWHICDGTQGTPDLRDKFVVGAGNKYAKGATGGEESHILTSNELAAHQHPGSETNMAGAHHHGAPYGENPGGNAGAMPFGLYDSSYTHWGSNDSDWDNPLLNTSTDGSHKHTITIGTAGGNQPHNNMPPYVALFYIMKL